jgi:transposase-like protein
MEYRMRQVTRYPAALKESVLAKAFASNPSSVVELAKEFNIPFGTIYTWVTTIKKQNVKQVNAPQRPNDKSASAKLQAVIDTMDKTEQERGAYCREHGIYTNHLDAWKKQMLEGLGSTVNTKEHKAEYQQAVKEVKQLKRDLNRKDKALAEVSALLILKKKADLLWGIEEDA